MTHTCRKRGFVLVAVLLVTAIGLLFGAGALLLFRYQCQLRIERQHELEKIYAVRSALNYLRINAAEIPEAKGKVLRYHTESGRDMTLVVKPARTIFPDVNNVRHFDMEKGHFGQELSERHAGCGYSEYFDYEYGVSALSGVADAVVTNKEIFVDGKWREGLELLGTNASHGATCWINIGMRDTGGWMQSEYGRRYCFWPRSYVTGESQCDAIRICLVRNVTNANKSVGYRLGWPLSMENERALVFEIRPKYEGGTDVARLYEKIYGAPDREYFRESGFSSLDYMGIQIAGNNVSLIHVHNEDLGVQSARGCTFSRQIAQLPPETYDYFVKEQKIGGVLYGGSVQDGEGRILSTPELRAVIEAEADSDRRKPVGAGLVSGEQDTLIRFKVMPAYQYDIFLEYPSAMTNLATVAQLFGRSDVYKGHIPTVLTYDTHGTENKGFRKDEREAERKRGIR